MKQDPGGTPNGFPAGTCGGPRRRDGTTSPNRPGTPSNAAGEPAGRGAGTIAGGLGPWPGPGSGRTGDGIRLRLCAGRAEGGAPVGSVVGDGARNRSPGSSSLRGGRAGGSADSHLDRVAGDGVQVDVGVTAGVGVIAVRGPVAGRGGNRPVWLVGVHVDVVVVVRGAVGGAGGAPGGGAATAAAEAELLLGGQPVRGDGLLGRGQRDPAVADGGVQRVFDLVLRVRRGRGLGPQVGGVVAPAELQRDQVVELGPLRLGGAVRGIGHVVLEVFGLRLGRPDRGGPALLADGRADVGLRDGRVDAARRAARVRELAAVAVGAVAVDRPGHVAGVVNLLQARPGGRGRRGGRGYRERDDGQGRGEGGQCGAH